ncbi:hypothetical protein KAU33_11540 [Candidatus Dependentiae bacterium]|nr:hypothetical protein [Candidatus Dependentiae bacterium]
MTKKIVLILGIIMVVFLTNCVRLEDEFLPNTEIVNREDGAFPKIVFTGDSPDDGQRISRNYVTFSWEGYDDLCLPSNLMFKTSFDDEEDSEWKSFNEKFVTHIEKGNHQFIVKCKTTEGRINSETVNFSITTEFTNDWDPPEILGYDYFHPNHSEFFLITSDGFEWSNSQFLEYEIDPAAFYILLNWDFCFRDVNDITPQEQLEYEIKILDNDIESEWIKLGHNTEFLFNVELYELILSKNFDEGKTLKFRVRCLDACGNISEFIEKTIEILFIPPELEILFFEWNTGAGREFFQFIWDDALEDGNIPALSIVLRNNSGYSGKVRVERNFFKYTFRFMKKLFDKPLADISKDIFLYDVLERKKINNEFLIHSKQVKEIRFVCDRDFEEVEDYEIYSAFLSLNGLKKLCKCYESDGDTVKNYLRINGDLSSDLISDQKGYYYNFPDWDLELIEPRVEYECSTYAADYFIKLYISSLNGVSEIMIEKDIGYNLFFKTNNR